jgi:ribonuclease E
MAKYMLIDATHREETRVALIKNNRLEDFDFETKVKPQIKSNIYLAKVIRVEPSLQAAFVDFGGNRHGFLAFSEIHPDYYRVPVSDRKEVEGEPVEGMVEADMGAEFLPEGEGVTTDEIETLGGVEGEEVAARKVKRHSKYKIQEVIKKRQIMLVQVIKEERGNKGAALTTYLSLAGRYCVLMPNAGREGGISRKITDNEDRKRLRSIIDSLELTDGMGLILRTAGMERTKPEIKRDYDYLIDLWNDIRNLTLKSTAPTLIHEEGALIKRAIRDLYSREIDKIIVDGEEGYQSARNFIRKITPSHLKKVELYNHHKMSLFQSFKVDDQIEAIFSPTVALPSGGYLVISQTEALVSIDVNSGRATRERHIEETAAKTNLEAAYEVARQLRLRNLAGLIVIDFIDMEDTRNITAVERRLKESMAEDKARIQIGRISPFGLLELSRQRLRPSVLEAHTGSCPHCQGTGMIRLTESAALHILRQVEVVAAQGQEKALVIFCNMDNVLYLLNQKRGQIREIESTYQVSLSFRPDATLFSPTFRIEKNLDDWVEIDTAPAPKKSLLLEGEIDLVEEDLDGVEEGAAEDMAPLEEVRRGREDRPSPNGKRRRNRRKPFPQGTPQESAEENRIAGEDVSERDKRGHAPSLSLQPEDEEREEGGNGLSEGASLHSDEEGEVNRHRRRRRRRRRDPWTPRSTEGEEVLPFSEAKGKDQGEETSPSWPSPRPSEPFISLSPGGDSPREAPLSVEGTGHPRKGWWQRLIKK